MKSSFSRAKWGSPSNAYKYKHTYLVGVGSLKEHIAGRFHAKSNDFQKLPISHEQCLNISSKMQPIQKQACLKKPTGH